MSRIVARRRVTRIRVGASTTTRPDALSVEEPLEIRVNGAPLTVTMRTPGSDVELANGFLVSEGIVHHREHIVTARYCAGAVAESDEGNTYNVLDLALAAGVTPPSEKQARAFLTTSACGVCGKSSIDQVRTESPFEVAGDPLRIDAALLATLPERLRNGQSVFNRTGGLHAAGLFDGTTGELLVLREDVGRHNAVDKVIGWALMQGQLPARSCVLMVSGRASFELTQKALMAGIPMLAAVSAPSSLAAELAEDAGLTLVGFLRGETMVVYTRPDRIENAGVDPESALHSERPPSPEKAELR